MARFRPQLLALLAMLLCEASPAIAAQPAPASKWTLGYDGKVCMLWGSYGSGRDAVRLGIKPSLTGDATRIYIVYRGAKHPNRWGTGFLAIDGGSEISVNFIDFRAAEPGRRFLKLELPVATARTFVSSPAFKLRGDRQRSLQVDAQGLREFDLRLDGLAGALPALERCVSDQVRRLGIDPASQARIAQRPQADLLKFFGEGDYPALAATLGISGRTTARLVVGADGRVFDCFVNESSGNAMLDHVTCETFLEDVRFTPAQNAAGQPVAAVLLQPVRWQVVD
jgi:TonB family protein